MTSRARRGAAVGAAGLIALAFAAAAAGHADRGASSLGPSYPQVSGNRIVWQDTGTGDTGLFDLDRARTSVAPYMRGSQVGLGQSPGIDGERFAYWDRSYRVRSRLMGYAPVVVSSSSVAEQSVVVSGMRVAWVDTRNAGIRQIYSATVGSGEARVSATSYLQQSPALSGSLLVWEDRRNGDADIYLKDGAATPVNLTRPPGVTGNQTNPQVSGSRIVWQDGRNGKDSSEDIYMLAAGQAPTAATNLTPDAFTTLSALMPEGSTEATVSSSSGFAVGDYVDVGVGQDIDRLRIASIPAATKLVFATQSSVNHQASNPVKVNSREQHPDIHSDASGYTVVFQTNRKSASELNFDISAARYSSGGSLVSTYQVTRTDIASETRPHIDGERIVYQLDVGGSSDIGVYELSPYAYGDSAGDGSATRESTRVPARASFAGHTVTYRYGFGSTAGATDLSGGYSAETASETVILVGSSAAPGSGEITVPAASIWRPEGSTYYVTIQVKEGGSWGATATSRIIKVDRTAPSAPASVMVVSGSGQASLSWSASSDGTGSGIDFYEVRRYSAGEGTVTVGETRDTSFVDDGSYGLASAPSMGVTYRYFVRTRDKAGNASEDAEGLVRPEPPSALAATPGFKQVALSWTNPSGDFAATRVLRSPTGYATDATPTGDQIQIYEGTGTSTTDTGLANDVKYYYTLYARSTMGAWSHPAKIAATPRRPSTSLSANRSTISVAYGGSVTIFGSLTDSSGVRLTGRTDVALYKSNNYAASVPTYVHVGPAAWDSATQTYRASASLISNTAFHLRFSGDADWAPATSRNVLVLSRAYLSRPTMSTYAPRRNMYFNIYGYLAPGHSGRTRIEFFRKVGSRYVLYRWYYGRNRKSSSTLAKYTLKTKLPAGYWLIRARHWDSGHDRSYSPSRTFRVR